MKKQTLTVSITALPVVMALLLNACSNASVAPSRAVGGSATKMARSFSESAGASPMKRSESASASAMKPAADRPGLGTELGGEATSQVSDATFYRRPGGRPDVVDSFYYNDEEGAKAMVGGGEGSPHQHSGRFDLAGGDLSVGLAGRSWYGAGGDLFPWFKGSGTRGRIVVIGQRGESYEISLKNESKKRLEVVASVDGLDVLDGHAASTSKHGYVLAPGQQMAIDGFRKDSGSVRTFLFGSVKNSAAAAAGAAQNVGVIGVAVYAEDEFAARQARAMEANNRAFARPFGDNAVRR